MDEGWGGVGGDLALCGGASNVQEVGGGAPMHLDDVHGGHGQASPVHHAPYLSIQPDVIQVCLGGCHISVQGGSGYQGGVGVGSSFWDQL
jgi:hypothetical protein